jgi:hypothetical protein
MNLQKFQEEYQTYNAPSEIRSECNAITFINVGTSNIQINGLNLTPGAQLVSPGNEGELNVTRYRLSFSGAGNEICLVIRKLYV